jgi:hypothetical protein
MRVLLKVETPLRTTINISNQSLKFIYQKLKTNIKAKEEKHRKRPKIEGHCLFDFLDTNTKFKTLETFEKLKSTHLKL